MQHEITEHELTGGAKLLAIHVPNAITYAWSSAFRAGFRFVPTASYELPHLAEHLAFEGTKEYPDSLVFKSEIERTGTYYNASTSFDWIDYVFAGSRDDLERIIPLNLTQIYEPLYRPEQIEQQKRVIEEEMGRYRENDSWRVGYLAGHSMIPALNPEINERIARIKDITQKQLLAYHRKYYGLANTRFILAGDFSAAEQKKIVVGLKKQLEGKPVGRPHQAKKEALGRFGKVEAFEPFLKEQAQFGLRFTKPGRDDERVVELAIVSVMLTGGLSARLSRKAREQGLTYGINSRVAMNYDYTSLSIGSQTSIGKLEPLIKLAAEELAAIVSNDYTDDEFERAKSYFAGSLRRSNQTPSALAGWYASDYVNGLPLESPEQRIARVEAVQRVDVNAVCKEYVRMPHMLLTMIGKGLKQKEGYYQAILEEHFA